MAKAAILVVENEAIIAKDIQHRLETAGYGVAGMAMTAQEAVQIATAMRPDLVLMDIRLNGKTDGIKAAEQIRDRLDVPIVFLTAYADDVTLARAKATEPYAYLLKPFEGRELHVAIEVAMRKHQRGRKFKEWVAATLRSINDAVIAADAKGLVTLLNPAAERLTGWQSEDAVGKDVREVFTVVNAGTAHVTESPGTKARRENAVVARDHSYILVAKNGIETPVEYSAAPIRNDHGDIAGTVLVFRDLTERKRADQQLESAYAELQQSHEELKTVQLQMIQAEKLESIGRLAAGVAHEVKNPLAIISQVVDYLEQKLELDRGPYAEDVRDIKEAVKRADSIIRGLLDFARPSKAVVRPTALKGVIDEALRLFAKQLTTKNVEVVKEIASALPQALLDKNQIKQVFINLIMNATQAMPDGGQLTIRTYTRTLMESDEGVGQRATDTFRSGETVLVCELEDTGVGIPEEQLGKVFDPFFTMKGPKEGTGLGLSITRSILERHRGTIKIQSQQGRGATVTILLPIAQGGANG